MYLYTDVVLNSLERDLDYYKKELDDCNNLYILSTTEDYKNQLMNEIELLEKMIVFRKFEKDKKKSKESRTYKYVKRFCFFILFLISTIVLLKNDGTDFSLSTSYMNKFLLATPLGGLLATVIYTIATAGFDELFKLYINDGKRFTTIAITLTCTIITFVFGYIYYPKMDAEKKYDELYASHTKLRYDYDKLYSEYKSSEEFASIDRERVQDLTEQLEISQMQIEDLEHDAKEMYRVIKKYIPHVIHQEAMLTTDYE